MYPECGWCVKKGRFWGPRVRVQALGALLTTKGSHWRILSKRKVQFGL